MERKQNTHDWPAAYYIVDGRDDMVIAKYGKEWGVILVDDWREDGMPIHWRAKIGPWFPTRYDAYRYAQDVR